MTQIPIPLDSELVGELFLRVGPKADISGWIENIVRDYLERTSNDDGWNDEYYEYLNKLMIQADLLQILYCHYIQ